jgi:repressor LexA
MDAQATLSKRQQAVLAAIEHLLACNGFPPTIREIGEEVGLASPSSVLHHVRALEDAGYLERRAHCPRAMIRLSDGLSQGLSPYSQHD